MVSKKIKERKLDSGISFLKKGGYKNYRIKEQIIKPSFKLKRQLIVSNILHRFKFLPLLILIF